MQKLNVINTSMIHAFKENKDFTGKKLFNENIAQVVEMTVKPFGTLAEHKTPVDVLFYVLDGNGILQIGPDTADLKPGDLVFSPANIPHGLQNPHDAEWKVLVLKIPSPISR